MMAVPDKRFTFDHRRPRTPLDHLVADIGRTVRRRSSTAVTCSSGPSTSSASAPAARTTNAGSRDSWPTAIPSTTTCGWRRTSSTSSSGRIVTPARHSRSKAGATRRRSEANASFS
jgi:hypothetical protein